MNFEKVSEGLASTIEKLSQKNKKTVTEERTKAQTLFERAMDPKGGAVTPTVPSATKTVSPTAAPAAKETKPAQTVYPKVLGQTATKKTFETLAAKTPESKKLRAEYLKTIGTQKLPGQ